MRWRVVSLLATLAAALMPTAAAGHAVVRGVSADGGHLRVSLSAPLEPGLTRVEIGGPAGRVRAGFEAARDGRGLDVPLGPSGAARTARWVGLASDGHVSRGRLDAEAGGRWSARGDGAGIDALTAVGRGLALAGLVGVTGFGIFLALVLGPASRSLRGDLALGSHARGAHRRVGLGLGASLAAAALGLLATILGTRLDLGAGSFGDLAATRVGHAWLAVGAATLTGCVVLVAGRPGPREGRAPRYGPAVAVCGAIGLGAVSYASHAASGADAGLAVAVDAAHTIGTAAWLGALVALVLVVPALGSSVAPDARPRVVGTVVVRFSNLAVVAVATILLTGVYRALSEIEGPGALVDTAYGRALLVKLAVFALLLGVGAVNRFVVHPRLERAAIGLAPTDRGASGILRRSLAAEVALGASVLALVAILASLPPPR